MSLSFSIDVRFHYLLTLFPILYNKDISVFSMTINLSYIICVCLCIVVSNTYWLYDVKQQLIIIDNFIVYLLTMSQFFSLYLERFNHRQLYCRLTDNCTVCLTVFRQIESYRTLLYTYWQFHSFSHCISTYWIIDNFIAYLLTISQFSPLYFDRLNNRPLYCILTDNVAVFLTVFREIES
jgi:hypothetical protein